MIDEVFFSASPSKTEIFKHLKVMVFSTLEFFSPLFSWGRRRHRHLFQMGCNFFHHQKKSPSKTYIYQPFTQLFTNQYPEIKNFGSWLIHNQPGKLVVSTWEAGWDPGRFLGHSCLKKGQLNPDLSGFQAGLSLTICVLAYAALSAGLVGTLGRWKGEGFLTGLGSLGWD